MVYGTHLLLGHHKLLFQNISSHKSPITHRKFVKIIQLSLTQANGDSLSIYGSAELTLQISSLIIHKQVHIANIQDEVLFVIDIANSIDVLISAKQVVIDGTKIPCTVIQVIQFQKFKLLKIQKFLH